MPETPTYGFPFEAPTDKPGISVTGVDGNEVLAEAVEAALANTDANITTLNNRIDTLEVTGYRFLQRVTFTASGSFIKASYAGIRAVRVFLVGGGGAGAGTAVTAAAQASAGTGGGAGAYGESFLLAASLAASETVTIGAAGVAVSGAAGGNGGTTSFGAFVTANGGGGGVLVNAGTTLFFTRGGVGGSAGTGDLVYGGEPGDAGGRLSSAQGIGSKGGSTTYGSGGLGGISTAVSLGTVGSGYGVGGGGSGTGASQAATAGANGTAGIVIVDVYI